jgi:two-component system, OmpR family, sensor histidine kinase KdpD
MTTRPNPDELLAQVQAEEAQAKRGSLKIFFGYAAGVGKTYAMLVNARQVKAAGRDVVIGYVEPHARPETQALVDALSHCRPRRSNTEASRCASSMSMQRWHNVLNWC